MRANWSAHLQSINLDNQKEVMIIAQISDVHLGLPNGETHLGVDTGKKLNEAVSHINQLKSLPDLVVVSGDCVWDGSIAEYEYLKSILEHLKMPYCLAVGNHDQRENMQLVFKNLDFLPQSSFVQYTLENFPLRVVVLDTLIPGDTSGELCEERLKWLDQTLSEAPERPTVIFQHHPPTRTGLAQLDGAILKNGNDLKAILERYNHVKLLGCGHFHRPIQQIFAGVLTATCPSASWQMQIEFKDVNQLTLTSEPIGYYLHYWEPDVGLVSHLDHIGEHGPIEELFF